MISGNPLILDVLNIATLLYHVLCYFLFNFVSLLSKEIQAYIISVCLN
jgi:hypothetical protein